MSESTFLRLINLPKWSTLDHKNKKMIMLTGTFLISHLLTTTFGIRKKLTDMLGEERWINIRANLSMGLYFPALYLYIFKTRNNSPVNDNLRIPIISEHQYLSKIGIFLKVIGFGCLPLFVGQSQPNAVHAGDMTPMDQRKSNAQNMDFIKGMVRITRHPLLLSMTNIFIGDILICGHYASLFFCAPMAFVCLFGLNHQDQRHKKIFGGESIWFKKTSAIPGHAMLTEKYSIKQIIEEIGSQRIAMSVGLTSFVYWYCTK
eukprot:236739_1